MGSLGLGAIDVNMVSTFMGELMGTSIIGFVVTASAAIGLMGFILRMLKGMTN